MMRPKDPGFLLCKALLQRGGPGSVWGRAEQAGNGLECLGALESPFPKVSAGNCAGASTAGKTSSAFLQFPMEIWEVTCRVSAAGHWSSPQCT